jgi:hypothetical protein
VLKELSRVLKKQGQHSGVLSPAFEPYLQVKPLLLLRLWSKASQGPKKHMPRVLKEHGRHSGVLSPAKSCQKLPKDDRKNVCVRTLGSPVLRNAPEKLRNRLQGCHQGYFSARRAAETVGWASGGHTRFASRFWSVPKEPPQPKSEGTFVQQF